MVADVKKVQTMINVVGDELSIIKAAVARLENIRARFAAANPSTAGTVLQGNKVILNTALTALVTAVGNPVWDAVINAKIDSHEGRAL